MLSVSRLALLLLLSLPPLFAADLTTTARVGFEKNQGQFPAQVLYALRPGAYLTANSLVLAPDQLSITFPGGNSAPAVLPSDTLLYSVNVYAGNDPSKWITGIQRFGQIEYPALYPGVDLFFTAEPFLTFRFVLAPGADSSAIQMNVPGCCGNPIVIFLQQGRIGLGSSAYQDTPAGRVKVDLGLTGNVGSTVYGFTLGAHDATLPVVIENTLPVAGSGGFSGNFGSPTAISPSGALYSAGEETQFVASGPPPINPPAPADGLCGSSSLKTPILCRDATVYKFSAAGDLLYVTYLSGSLDEEATALAVNAADETYVTGVTDSADFPVTAGASQKNYAGPAPTQFADPPAGDVFVAKLDSAGKLISSTYLGGPNADLARSIFLDSSGNAYIGGPSSAALPVTSAALQGTPCTFGPVGQACIIGYLAKVDPTGHLAFLTYLPGAPSTFLVDAVGDTYFAGSIPGPLPANAQVFVAKLNPSGSALLYNTAYSSLGATAVNNLAIDSQGNAWLSGPDQADMTSTSVNEFFHPYLVKFSADGSKVLYETPFLGGHLSIGANDDLAILTDNFGTQTIRTPGGMVTSACSPVTISLLDPNGKVLRNEPLAVNSAIFLSGSTLLTYNNPQPMAILPVAPGPSMDTACTLNSASLSIPNKVAPGEIITIFGRNLGPSAGAAFKLDAHNRVPTSVGGVQVLFDGVPAPVLYADDGQVNAVAPFSLLVGNATSIQAQYQGQRTPVINATVVAAAPAIFSLDGSGLGRALVFNQDGTLNSPANPAKLGSIVTMFSTGIGATSPPSVEGAVATSLDARPVTPPSVILGGRIAAQVLYAGPSPGSLTSVTQLNVQLPASVAAGLSAFPLSQWPILIDTGQTTEVVTIALTP